MTKYDINGGMVNNNLKRCKNVRNEEQAKKTKELIDQRSKRRKTKETENIS